MLPLQLSGKNLGERQKQLNDIIKDTDSWDPNYDITNENDNDIDIIYKIKLASKLKKFKYLVEMLKNDDSLYISKVLKQLWIYGTEYSDIINPHYLHKEVFPYMSEKMIKKLLSALSMHIKDETRLISFSEYCYARDRKDIGNKFLFRASESSKLDFLKKYLIPRYDKDFVKVFVGNSFQLANACLEKDIWITPLYFTALYTASSSLYLDILEKYEERIKQNHREKFGLRLSKGIVKNYKNRILERPQLYWKCLCSKVLLKNINANDAKIIVAALFPKNVTDFWKNNFCDSYKNLVNIIPPEARYQFIKDNFKRKYGEEEFEMTWKFFDSSMYTLMTRKEQESWALKHLEKNEGFFGDMNNYSWYKFVSFDLSFTRLKSIIKITIDKDRRIKLLGVLLESTCNQDELEVLLKYFYERHINEQKRDRFVEKVVEKYNIFELNANCWSAFNKLLHALEVYNQHTEYGDVTKFRAVSLFYHILHDLSLPECLNTFITKGFYLFYIKLYFEKLNNKQKVYDFLINYLIREIEHYENEEYSNKIQDTVRPLLLTAIDLLQVFDKKVGDYPNLITKYAKQDIDHFGHIFKKEVVCNKLTQDDFLRLLKKDVSLLNKKIPVINDSSSGVLNTFLKKIKVYFCNDTAKEWLKHFTNVLDTERYCCRAITLATYAIFTLADNEQKNSMMIKYTPKSAKVDHSTINFHEYNVQEAICRFVAYSRPPVPLNTMLLYIKGDYVRFCMPMFGMIMSNWSKPKCIAFIQLLLDTPVSVQKHGIRLAFKCFNSQDLSKLVINSWKQTKNVSLKTILFKSLYRHIGREENKDMQKELIETLKSLMTEAQDSHEDIYACFGGTLIPDCFKRDFLEHAWNIVKKLPDDNVNQSRKREVLVYVKCAYCLMDEHFVHEIVKAIIEECMTMPKIAERNISYYDTKWGLVVKHIVNNKSENSIAKKLILLKEITSKTIEMWNETHKDSYIMRDFLVDFIQNIEESALKTYLRSSEKTKLTILFTTIQDSLVSLPNLDIYLIIWKLKFNMVFHNTIHSYTLDIGHLPTNYKEFNEMVILLGKAVASTLKEFVDRGQFFSTLLHYIKEMLNRLSYSMYIPMDGWNLSAGSDSYGVLLGVGLVATDMVEAHMLALKMLPSECPEEWENEFHLIINKIKSIDNKELQFSLHHKYCGDFKRRKFM